MKAPAFRVGARRETAEGLEVAVTIPADCPWFEGHFPGQPILPGVAHLQLACQLAGQPAGELASPSSCELPTGDPAAPVVVEAWRWSGQVAPGEALIAALAPAGEGRTRFTLRRATDSQTAADGGGGQPAVVSSGTFAWAANGVAPGAAPGKAAGPPAEPPPGSATSPEPPAAASSADRSPAGRPVAGRSVADRPLAHRPLADLLPHQPPARLAEDLLEVGPEHLVCRGRIGAGHTAVSRHGAPAFLAIELAAQACAGWALESGAGAAEDGGEESAGAVGYLVRVRGVRFSRSWLPPAATLTAHLEIEARSGPLTLCRFRVGDDAGAEVASGNLGVFQPSGESLPAAG